MQAAFATHWFRFSTAEQDVDHVLDSIAGVSGGDFGPVEQRGRFNQPMRFLHTTGTAVYFGSKKDAQPIVVDVPGEACELVSVHDLSTWAENVKGRVSRIDLAVDVEPASDARRRLLEMHDEFRKGACDTRIPKTSNLLIQSDQPGDGWTLYVGSRQSDTMCRVYDRRGPLRVEWEFKPSNVQVRESLPSTLRRFGAAGLWRGVAQACIWPMPWYQDVLKGQCADIARCPTKPNDLARTMSAILEQLGPTLAALQLAGVGLGELACMPTKPNAEQLRKWEAWVAQAPDLGYDPKLLEAEVSRWRRSRSRPRS
jgi:hypothetical protein